MWICVSKARLRLSLGIILFIYALLACGFYIVQNKGLLPGGNIAVPKLFWLGMVILCWYILPLLFSLDAQFNEVKTVLLIFLLNMFLRAVVELVMMFYTQNWHPHYGIGHDIFSLLLSLGLASQVHGSSVLIRYYLMVMALLFTIESGFAWYMLHHVQQGSGAVYYVPAGDSHQFVLNMTTAVVWVMSTYLILFIRTWLYGSVTR